MLFPSVEVASWNKGAGVSFPSRRGQVWLRREASGGGGLRIVRFGGLFCAPRSPDLGSFWSLRSVDETMASSARCGDSVLQPCLRRGVVSSCGAAGLVRGYCVGGKLLLVGISGPFRGGRLGGDLRGVDFGFVSRWRGGAISGGLDAAAVSFSLAGRGGEEGDGDGAAGVDLFWWGYAEAGMCLRLSLFLELATTCWWWLGEVSPPMVVQRHIFRRSARMFHAVLQRSVSAIEPHLLVGVRLLLLLLLRRCSGGVGGGIWQLVRWSSWRTYRGFLVISLFDRGLSALFPGQVAFGLLLGWGCVFVIWVCFSLLC